jgi:hypothetical protein
LVLVTTFRFISIWLEMKWNAIKKK